MADDAVRQATLRAVSDHLRPDQRADGHDTVVPSPDDYFHHVATEELAQADAAVLAGVMAAHAALAATDERPAIRVWTPDPDSGWSLHGNWAVDVVSDDGPFLVDTISLTLTRLGWEIHDLFHPQFTRVTTPEGTTLTRTEANGDHAGDPDEAGGHGGQRSEAESWVHIEATPPSADPGDATTLAAALRSALDDLTVAVDDFVPMRTAVRDIARRVRQQGLPDAAEAAEVADLLQWLTDGNFVVLGLRQHRLVPSSGENSGDPSVNHRFETVPGTGLGLLREDRPPVSDYEALPADPDAAQLLLITKDSARSTVRRPGQYDHLSVRTFDDDGRCTGEFRILGLLASTAYIEQVSRIPVLKAKVAQIHEFAGYPPDSYGAKAVTSTIATYPRDELFQASVEQLAPVIVRLAELRERRELCAFLRWGTRRRFLYVLVSLPRDRYTTESRKAMEQVIAARVPVETIDFRTTFSESVLCRVFFTVKLDETRERADLDPDEVQAALAAAVRTWDDEFAALAAGMPHRDVVFPDGFKEDGTPQQGLLDLQQLMLLRDADDMQLAMFPSSAPEVDQAPWRVKVMRHGALPLTQVMPQFTSLGLEVVDERPYEVSLQGESVMVYDFGLKAGAQPWSEPDTQRILAGFEAIHRGWVEVDPLNELVTRAGLTWHQVHLLRALSRYLLQAQSTYSQAYIAQTLLALPGLAAGLVEMMETKFDPDLDLTLDARRAAVDEVRDRIRHDLDQVSALDHDRIVRQLMAVIDACVRTNHYQRDTQALTLKLLPGHLDFLPEPRPAFEMFVHSPRVEGVHLRFGPVARGGLRWSDRAEDFRTEVLGLVKAQLVKNTVIVPVGAKGGFLPRQLPDASVDRAAWLAEGQACYRIFIGSLLDVTDNRVGAEIVHPERTVLHDDDDSYLVVAADKGTATFSDLANEISTSRGFWLGDAFASGGSHGYDHKAMGITARGAWESVKRHFGDQGIDCQTTDFTAVGIGDMSGDVFGNGMLCSEHTRLVGAFNHLHIFIDPTPDAAVGHAERRRLFDLPRSNWTDYDASLISEGGGVFDRSAKSIAITDQMRTALGLEPHVTELTGSELVRAVLAAPVDLLWNGGIGTYVKASTETHADVGDRVNDQVRIDATQLRCGCVGEGGNLGFTQPARVEYARAGGRINTDFIDNSAGVDTSDHEVNIKILLGRVIADGNLDEQRRNALLPEMTDEVATLVLRHNIDQNTALANSVSRAADMAGVHESWMQRLERESQFDREVEDMPSTHEMASRIAAGEGLVTPELATLMAWTKIWLADQLIVTDLPDDPYLADRLIAYFPAQLREQYTATMREHPLRREIITTVAVNRFVNSQGISSAFRLTDEFGCGTDDVVRAQLAARSVHGVAAAEIATARSTVHPDLQRELRLALRRLVDRATRWVLQNLPRGFDIQATIEAYQPGVAQVQQHLADLLTAIDRRALLERRDRYVAAGVEPDLAQLAAAAPFAHTAMGLVQVADESGRDLMVAAGTQLSLQARLGLDQLLARIEALPRKDRWQAQARAALRSDLLGLTSQLTLAALAAAPEATSPAQVVDTWWAQVPTVDDKVALLADITTSVEGLAPLQVALRTVRSLAADAVVAA